MKTRIYRNFRNALYYIPMGSKGNHLKEKEVEVKYRLSFQKEQQENEES